MTKASVMMTVHVYEEQAWKGREDADVVATAMGEGVDASTGDVEVAASKASVCQ